MRDCLAAFLFTSLGFVPLTLCLFTALMLALSLLLELPLFALPGLLLS